MDFKEHETTTNAKHKPSVRQGQSKGPGADEE